MYKIGAFILILFLIGITSGATLTSKVIANGGTLSDTASVYTQAGTNIMKFGDKNASYNELDSMTRTVTSGRSYLNGDTSISAISNNRVTNTKTVITDGMVVTEDGAGMLTAGSIMTTGCDAGSLGATSTGESSTGLASNYPVTDKITGKVSLMASGNGTQFSTATGLAGDNYALNGEGKYGSGVMHGSTIASTVKSFTTNTTENYAQTFDRFSNLQADKNLTKNGTLSYGYMDTSMNTMASAFDTITSTNSTEQKVQTVVTNSSL